MRWPLPLSLLTAHYKNESNNTQKELLEKVSDSHCLGEARFELSASLVRSKKLQERNPERY